jgi:hypothetical protein
MADIFGCGIRRQDMKIVSYARGDRRKRSGFLFIPRTVYMCRNGGRDETRWLEWATWIERFDGAFGWETVEWVD